MTPIKNSTFIRKVKDITIAGAIAVTLLGSTIALQSCGTSTSEQEEVYTLGVRTYIAETEKGVFKIMDEEEVPVDSSQAVVTYLDGKRDTLSPQVVKSLIDHEVRNNPHEVGQGFNLSNALLYGGMGYLLARTLSPNYNNMRNQPSSGFYQNQTAHQKASGIQQNIGNSRTMVSRPAGAKSGFMRSSAGRSTGASS
jgi:hypothetical protein